MTSQLLIRSLLLRNRIPSHCLGSVTSIFKISRSYASTQPKSSSSLTEAKQRSELSEEVKPLGEKIKENTKTASYMGVILLGITVTGVMFFAIFRELFSSQSPNNVYSEALEKCKNDTRIQDALGAPIKGFGEETRRGRRRHVAHTVYEKDGRLYMRMQFYIQGIRNKGTVHLEMRMNDKGKYEYRYLFVQLDYYPHQTIVLEDNRSSDPVPQGNQGYSLQTLN
uniref:Mitochondrial import inner membrane translocase subunit Tim21 n=1 Tax=Culicoides sonorensis TaxID=179676 RepID=A0A336MEB7_CULSO